MPYLEVMTHGQVPQIDKSVFIFFSVFSDSVAPQFTWILLNFFALKQTMTAVDTKSLKELNMMQKMFVIKHMAWQKNSSNNGTLSCPKCPTISTKKKENLNYHLTKYQSPINVKPSNMYTLCLQDFPCFFCKRKEKMKYWQKLGQIDWKSQWSPRIGEITEKQRAITSRAQCLPALL